MPSFITLSQTHTKFSENTQTVKTHKSRTLHTISDKNVNYQGNQREKLWFPQNGK